MKRVVIVSDAADHDSTGIYDRIAEDGRRAAYRMIDRFRDRFAEIAESPS